MPRPSLCGSPSRLFHGSCALALFMHSKHSKINKNSWSLFAVNMSISFLRMPSARRSNSSSNNCRNSSLFATTQLFFFRGATTCLPGFLSFPFLSNSSSLIEWKIQNIGARAFSFFCSCDCFVALCDYGKSQIVWVLHCTWKLCHSPDALIKVPIYEWHRLKIFSAVIDSSISSFLDWHSIYVLI